MRVQGFLYFPWSRRGGAINGNQVTITLTGAPDEVTVSLFSVNDSNGNVYAVTQVAPSQVDDEYILTLGTAVTGKGTLTVTAGSSHASKDFDTTILGLKLDVSVDEEDSILTADGADNAVITVKVLRDGEPDTSFKGTVKFQSLKGARFAKEEVAFDQSVAQVQVTSISSPVEILDTIIATIANADDPEFVGTQARINLKYVPEDGNQNIDKKAFVTYAESDRASDVFVRFNDKINFEKLYAAWITGAVKFTITNGAKTIIDNGIFDIKKINDNTIQIVLPSASALTDNSSVTVAVDDERINGIIQKSSISFNLVDSNAPKAVKVTAVDYKTLVAEFTEPLNPQDAQTIENWVLNGKRLAAEDIITDGIKVGNIINEDGDVSEYANGVDNRHFLTIKLVDADENDATTIGVEKYKNAGQKNLLQAYNITDYAGMSDKTGQNKATTQEFEFITPAVPNAPTATITMDSPEQFKIEFSAAVEKAAGGELALDDFVVERQEGVNADGTPVWVASEANQDGTQFAVSLNKESNSVYYIELLNDWTQILDTDTNKISYYTPDYNKVKITLKANTVKSLRTGVKISSAIEKTIDLNIDANAPTFTAEQVITPVGPQQEVLVTMSEPIKFPAGNTEGPTPSQKQIDSVPAPTFEFVSADMKTTILGSLKAGSLTENDKSFVIEPDEDLVAGEWTVYIRSISDDVGNTSDTLAQTLTILPTTVDPVAGEPRIIWAAAIDNTDVKQDNALVLQDVVFVQFGTEMSLDALKSNIYTINGKALPEGVSITSEDIKYSGDLIGTRVMLTLPHGFLGDVSETYVGTESSPHMLSVNKRLSDVNNNALIGKNEVQLSYDFDGAGTVGVIPGIDELITGDAPAPANQAPIVDNSIGNEAGTVGGGDVIVDASLTFSDADGDALTLTAVSSDEAVATVTVNGTDVVITQVAEGTATITVTADDGNGGTVDTTFDIVISN